MVFNSILNENENSSKQEITEAPNFFRDLNLDQIVNSITAGKEEHNLKSFFYTPLNTIKLITYRHEIFQDLENKILFEYIKLFTKKMNTLHLYLSLTGNLHYNTIYH